MTTTKTISGPALTRAIVTSRLRTLAGGMLAALAFAAAILVAYKPASAQATSNPSLFLADFNHDGIPDVLVPSPSTSSFTLTLGSVPFGSFSSGSTSVPYPANCTTVVSGGVAIADFNGDGFADIALTCTHSPSTFLSYTTYILLGVGDGSFTPASASLAGLRLLAAGDFNHDGKMDLAEVGGTGHTNGVFIYLYPGNGDGTFGARTTSTLQTTAYTAALAVDLDNNGYPDLALGNFTTTGSSTLDIYGNNQDGTFGIAGDVTTPNTTVAVGAYPATNDAAILTGNFFGTGLPDLAVVDTGPTPGIYVIQNNSRDGFSFGTAAKTASTGLTGAVAASFTTSFSDLLVSDGTQFTVLANNGTGNFAATYTGLAAANASTLFAAADANFDGHADIYTAAPTSTGTSLTVDMVSGSASASAQPFTMPAGTFPVSAAWPGNVNFNGFTLNGTQTVGGIMPTITWATPAPIPYGTALSATQLDAAATNASGVAVPGTFTYSPAAGTVLATGTHALNVTFTPTDLVTYSVATGTVNLVVNKAAPAIAWAAPAPLAYGIPLSATQLDATATDINGASLAGNFVYTPAAGAILTPGIHTLSVTFTPTDTADYTVATATVNITITDITLSSFTPTSVPLGSPATTITVTGSGLVATTVAQVNGTAIPTTLVNPTTLTAVVPASDFLALGTLKITLFNPATGSTSAAASLTVTVPAVTGTLTAPPTATPGTQPSLTFNIPPYPVDLTATLTVSLKSSLASGVTDSNNVVFSNGSSTYTFTIPANSTTIPAIPLAVGTVAETITVTPELFVGTANVTPDTLEPAVIDVPAAVPQAMSTTLTRSGTTMTVTIIGFSNTREIVSAAFHFIPTPGATLTTSDFSPPVNGIFSGWFDGDNDSASYGSSFTYTQDFDVSDTAANIGSVQVTLTNSVGVSTVYTAQ